ncbi:hypothetical protein LIER_05818 [Lithospermum erythrorhizon]|uniref:Uncharacterized protein n=1 Tax=Lithospermum erythrorhizon TaxID=34254 RepID=A0AAV3P385_LITER
MEMNDQAGPFRGGYPTSSSNFESYSDEYLIVSNNTICHSSDSGFSRQELLDKGQDSKIEQTDINNSIVSSVAQMFLVNQDRGNQGSNDCSDKIVESGFYGMVPLINDPGMVLKDDESKSTSFCFLTCIYGHPNLNKRLETWNFIAQHLKPLSHLSTLLCGNFNQVLLRTEKHPPPKSTIPRSLHFLNLINDLALKISPIRIVNFHGQELGVEEINLKNWIEL